jgi:hypothetical protein
MNYIEAVKDGFGVINRNWQLVLIQVAMVFISTIGFFIMVGLPLAIAFIIFGIDLTGLTNLRDIFGVLKGPSDIISKYLGIILMILSSLLLYLIVVALLGIYLFGGSIGIIGSSIMDKTRRFTLRMFLDESKRLFLRLLGFTSVIGLILIIAAFSMGILGGGIASVISYARTQDSTLAIFFSTFLSLTLFIVALVLILAILSVTLYGFATLFFKSSGAFRSISAAVKFLMKYPDAFWLYALLLAGYLLASFLLILFGYPFTLIPIIGTILSFPYQLISYAFQTYLGLVIIATILTYYYSKEIAAEPAGPAIESPPAETGGHEKDASHDSGGQ